MSAQIVKQLEAWVRRLNDGNTSKAPSPMRRRQKRHHLPEQVHIITSKDAFLKAMGFNSSVKNDADLKRKDGTFAGALEKICRGGVKVDYIAKLMSRSEPKRVALDNHVEHGPWRYFTIAKTWKKIEIEGKTPQGDKTKKTVTVVDDPKGGFAIGHFLDANRFGQRIFFIDLICTDESRKSASAVLLRAIENEALRHECTKLWLASVVGATSAYKRMGFDFGPVCEGDTAYPPGARLIIRKIAPHAFIPGQVNVLGRPVPRPTPARLFRINKLGDFDENLGNRGNFGPHKNSNDDVFLMVKCLKHDASRKRKLIMNHSNRGTKPRPDQASTSKSR